jgi:hypothetical protein
LYSRKSLITTRMNEMAKGQVFGWMRESKGGRKVKVK